MVFVGSTWFREFLIVLLIIILLIHFYYHFVATAKRAGARSRPRRLHSIIMHTRILLAALVLLLICTTVYDHVILTKQETKQTDSSSITVSHKTRHVSKKQKNNQHAVEIVKGYYHKNPNEKKSHVHNYKYVGRGTDNDVSIIKVGGYNSAGTLEHMFYVHKDGMFDVAY